MTGQIMISISCDLNRISQVFQGLKSTDKLEILHVFDFTGLGGESLI